ncbi:MAG: glycosyltransferase family 4 protein [Chloroflexi bacterium]|nr:glycosyltransferase family 4 protein [Chloroflexota bacterium]
MGPFPPRPGGVSVQCEMLSAQLTAAGARVTRINTDVRWLRQAGRLGHLLLPLAQVLWLLWQMLRSRNEWQVLHVHVASWWGFMPAVVGLMAGRRRRLILSTHGGAAAAFLQRWQWLVRSVLRRYHAVLTLTPTQAAIFRQHGISADIVPNIVPVERFHFRLRGPLTPRILWLRQLEPRYRPHDALDVLLQVQQQAPVATLSLVGGGDMRCEIGRRIEEESLQGVYLHGPARSHEIPTLYAEADIFLNTSAIDNLPLTLIEASASGLPIVSTDAGAIPDLISDGVNGLLAPVGDTRLLAQHIVQLLNDPARAQQLSRAARRNAERFSWRQIAPYLARAYALNPPIP